MLDVAVHMCVRNDVYYLPMALQSILPYVKGVYIQDQMSTDGTWETARDFYLPQMGKENFKIAIDRVDTGTPERFTPDYDEPKWRSLALDRTEEIFKPKWLLKCDADEIYSEYFFRKLEDLLSGNPTFNGVKVSGHRFISLNRIATHPSAIEKSPDGGIFHDPHTQVWRAGMGFRYVCNPDFTGYLHPILEPSPTPLFWLPGICNIHLHRTFGPKAYKFWFEGDDPDKTPRSPFHPPSMVPNWYNSAVNLGNSEEVKFEWPDYVLNKWREWGIW